MSGARVFHLEDLDITVPVYWDEISGMYLYDFPIFITTPLHTGTGRPCVNAWQEACEHVKAKAGITVKNKDCGCCVYFQTEKERDLIGVCMCNLNRHKE